MSTDEPTPGTPAPGTPEPGTPEPVQGVRKSAAVHIHPVADPDAWRSASLPDPVAPKPDPVGHDEAAP